MKRDSIARLAGGLVRWRFAVVAVWLVLIALGAWQAGRLGELVRDDTGAHSRSSTRANAILKDRFGLNAMNEIALVYERTAPESTAVTFYRHRLENAVSRIAGVASLRPITLPEPAPGFVIRQVRLDAALSEAEAGHVAAAVKACLAANPPPAGARTYLLGRPLIAAEVAGLSRSETSRIETLSLVLALVVLVLVFGSLVAALLPLAMGLASITTSLGAIAALNGLVPVSNMTRLIAGVIAIAIGIDYALFLVGRYREERSGGAPIEAAVDAALRRSGKAVLFSGLILAVSVAALAIPDYSPTRAVAGAVVLVVLASLAASFTLLPALLVIADRRIGTSPGPLRRFLPGATLWRGLTRRVLAHHRLALAVVGLALVALAWQTAHMRLWQPGPTVLPPTLASRQGYDALARAGLAGEVDAFYVTLHQGPAPGGLAPATAAEAAAITRALESDQRIRRVDTAFKGMGPQEAARVAAILATPIGRVTLGPRLAPGLVQDASGSDVLLRVVPRMGLENPALVTLVTDVQRRLAARAPVPGVQVDLGGTAPRRVDFTREMYDHLGLIALVCTGGVYGLLLLYFRSLVLPAKAVLMNALPILGACGALVLVFQHGLGAAWIGLEAPGAVMAMTPIVVFCLAFGLGMDYEVLILSRIDEAHRAGLSDHDAIEEGMARTSGLVTGAAVIMLSVFAPNIFSELVSAKEIGLGLSAAILLDATLVRLVLVPAFMAALGRWNWYMPGRAGRMGSPAQDEAAA